MTKETDKWEEIWCHGVYIFAVSKKLAIIVFYLEIENWGGTLVPSVNSGKIWLAFLFMRSLQLSLILPTIVSTQFLCPTFIDGTIQKSLNVIKSPSLHIFLTEQNWFSYGYCWSGSFSWVVSLSIVFLLLLISLIIYAKPQRPSQNWMSRGIISKPVLFCFWCTSNNYRSELTTALAWSFIRLCLPSCALISPHMAYTWSYWFTPVFIIVPSHHGHFPLLSTMSYSINSHCSYYQSHGSKAQCF